MSPTVGCKAYAPYETRCRVHDERGAFTVTDAHGVIRRGDRYCVKNVSDWPGVVHMRYDTE